MNHDSLLIKGFFLVFTTSCVLACAFADITVLIAPFIGVIGAARFLKGVGSKP